MGILQRLAQAVGPRPSDALIRAVAAEVIAFAGGQPAEAVLKGLVTKRRGHSSRALRPYRRQRRRPALETHQ
jgi:hypothetical protein